MSYILPRAALALIAFVCVAACRDTVTAPSGEEPEAMESSITNGIRVTHLWSASGDEARRKWAERVDSPRDPPDPDWNGTGATSAPAAPAANLDAADETILRITRAETDLSIIREGNIGKGLAQVWVVTETNISARITTSSNVNLRIGDMSAPPLRFDSPPQVAKSLQLDAFEFQGFHCNVEGGVTMLATTRHEATAMLGMFNAPAAGSGDNAACGTPAPPSCEVSGGNDLNPYSTEFDPYAPDGSGSEECRTGDGTGGSGDGSGTQYNPGDTTTERVEWSTGIGTGDPTSCDLATVEWICIDKWDETTKTWKTWSCGYATVCS